MSRGFPDEFPFNHRPTLGPSAKTSRDDARDLATAIDVFSNFVQIGEQELLPTPEAIRTPPPPIGTERRRAARQTLVARATLRPESNFTGCGPLAAGYISNISMKGVGFHTRRPLLVGESYHMKFEVGPLKWQTRLRVVTCKPHTQSTYDVGAEFISNELNVRPVAA